jgi:putative ABC transport system substrate-binding protein
VESSAKALKLELEQFAVKGMADAENTFAKIAKHRNSAALIIDDPITISNAVVLAEQAMKHKLATGGNFIEYAEAGGLMAYGANLVALWRRAASFVDKILKGTSPGEIPVERATRFELVINRRTAAAIDVSISQSILLRADRSIE